MGSLAEKLIHFVTKRSIHEFFFSITYQSEFVAICKGRPDHVPTTFKNQLAKSEMQILLTLLFFLFTPYFVIFHVISSFFIQSQHIDYYTSTWSGPKFLEKVWCLAIVIISSSLWAKGVFSTPSGIKQRVKDSPSRVSLLSHPSGCKSLSNLTWDETRKSNIREVLCIFKEFHHRFLTPQILTFSPEKI